MTAKNFGEVHGGGGADQPGEKTATAIVSGRGVIHFDGSKHDGSGHARPGETITLPQSEIERLIKTGALKNPAGYPGRYVNGVWVHSTLRK